MSGTPEQDVKPKPKPALVRLGQNGSPGLPGRAGQPLARLNTFKAPRDLTLGAAQAKPTERKKFVPNLNVTRNIKKEPEEGGGGQGGRREDRRRGGRRDRGEKRERKEKPALIQSMGSIFAEGVGGVGGIRRRGAGGGSYDREQGAEGGMQRPKLEMNIKYDKDEEEARLKELLRDDFIDDLTSGGYVPVQLPMVDTGKIFKEEVKKENKLKLEESDTIKPSNLNTRSKELDSDDDDDPDDIKVPPATAPPLPNPLQPDVSVADLVKTQKGDLLFIQLPDHLPGMKTKREDGRMACQLDSLEEGCVGKLQIRASGACQLVLGDQVLSVEVGTRVGFLQDAVSVQLPQEEGGVGNMTVLGHVKHRLVVTPDWDFLMEKAGLCSTLA